MSDFTGKHEATGAIKFLNANDSELSDGKAYQDEIVLGQITTKGRVHGVSG